MDWSAELRSVLPPPAHRAAAPTAADWAAAEAALGVTLPADYKQFLSGWGPAQIGAFFHTLSPGHPNRVVELVEKARTSPTPSAPSRPITPGPTPRRCSPRRAVPSPGA